MSTSAAPECGCLSRKTNLTQSTCPMAARRSVVLKKNVYEDWRAPMEGVVVEVRVRHLVNDSQIRTTGSAIALHVVLITTMQSFTAFFP